MPVTDHEICISDGEMLVSKTDLKGAITYVNPAFLEISGFSEKELIGNNHNVVRHPDMPSEVFQDLWQTLKSGLPWTGAIKNRCKNGDFYWVKAKVTPIIKEGAVIEFVSVREKINENDIKNAEITYQKIKNNDIILKQGLPVKKGFLSFLKNKLTLKLKQEFMLIGGGFLILLSLVGISIKSEIDSVIFVNKEISGISYITPLSILLRDIQIHRGLSTLYIAGDRGIKKELQDSAQSIETKINSMKEVDAQLGDDLKTHANFNNIITMWNNLRMQEFQLTLAENFNQHNTISESIITLVAKVGDSSNLIVDPEQDGFYAIDLILNEILHLSNLTGQARDLSASLLLSNNTLGQQQIDALKAYVSSYPSTLNSMLGVYIQGSESRSEFKSALDPSYHVLNEKAQRFNQQINQLISMENTNLSASDLYQSGTQAFNAIFTFFSNTETYLNDILDTRAQKLTWLMYSLVSSVVFLSLLILIVGIKVTKTLFSSLEKAKKHFAEISEQNYHGDILVTGNNELSDMLNSLKSMQIRLGFSVDEARNREEEATRSAQALEACSTNVLFADNNLDITYLNPAIKKLFIEAETEMKNDIPGFNARELIGANLETFHHEEHEHLARVKTLKEGFSYQLKKGGRTFNKDVTPVFNKQGEKIGTVVEWHDRTKELKRIEEERIVSDANARMKQALDTVSANVMVADANRDIIYMNQAVTKTLSVAESDIQTELSNFSVHNLMGNSIDVFHKNPAHQQQLLENLTSEYVANIIVGGRHMRLIVNPITNDQNERIGTVVEWTDRTNEVAIELEIDSLVDAAASGDLSKRIDPEGKSGFFAKLAKGLNQTVESTDSFVKDMGIVLSAMSSGDLTKSINKEYLGSFGDLKGDVNQTISQITGVISKIRESSNLVQSASSEIYQGNDDLSRRTEAQASALEETASSMEEMTITVKESAGNAAEANEMTVGAKQKAAEGGSVVKGAIKAMGDINESSNKINDIIGVIDEIAFQTNLLALNAAVEAARAGEQGRGFAVVAGEVRTLSQRSAAAAKEIKDLIRDSMSKVELGSKLVNESGATLDEIVTAIEDVAGRVETMATATAEQNAGIGQINQAISQMDDMTQQNAALVEEASAASRALSEQAEVLNKLVSFFKVG